MENEQNIILNLSITQAALLAVCISTTALIAAGGEPSRLLADTVFQGQEDLTYIMDSLQDQVCGFPDAADVEEWLKS